MDRRERNDEAELQRVIADVKRRQTYTRMPRKAQTIINQLLARRGYANLQEADLSDAVWQQIVGPALASCSRPGRVKRGVLEVFASNSAALQELTFHKAGLLTKLQAAIPERQIRNLRFRVGQV